MRCALVLSLCILPGCSGESQGERAASSMTGGDPTAGRDTIDRKGCASCHIIPGIRDADGLVGPPLDRIASRTYIAGVILNNSSNMLRWLRDPPSVDPLTAMPNLHLTEQEARDIAAYLYTLK